MKQRVVLEPETPQEWIDWYVSLAKKANEKMKKERAQFGYELTHTWHDYDDAIKGIGRSYFGMIKEKEDIKDLDHVTKLMAPYLPH